ncbi:yddQ [Symbiodinium natans]|uniref:YddQ protein n=1 Tax=Symbiodinium natans TaxID=878477 RepID=A0A812HWD4_9DINO|nr:yddQ [Symbiodinium natans]
MVLLACLGHTLLKYAQVGSAALPKAPKKRPAASTKASITISGGTFLKKHGIQDALETILAELEDAKPSDPWTSLQAALQEKSCKKAKMDEEVCWTAFPSPGDLVWREAAKARSEAGTSSGVASIVCKGQDRSFPVDPKDTALVLIDMQFDFLESTGRVGQHYKDLTSVQSGMDGCERLLAACRNAGFTIAHSRSHRYGSVVRSDLVGTSDEGYELHPRMRAREGEIVVDKWTFGAFASTYLERELRKRGVKRILSTTQMPRVLPCPTSTWGTNWILCSSTIATQHVSAILPLSDRDTSPHAVVGKS